MDRSLIGRIGRTEVQVMLKDTGTTQTILTVRNYRGIFPDALAIAMFLKDVEWSKRRHLSDQETPPPSPLDLYALIASDGNPRRFRVVHYAPENKEIQRPTQPSS